MNRLLLAILTAIILLTALPTVEAQPAARSGEVSKKKSSRKGRVQAEGETGRKLEEIRAERMKNAGYKSWKRRLPFWPRKAFLLAELALFITIGVLVGQMLEVSGYVRYFAILTWPVLKMGRLGATAGPAFLMAFQSGAVANSMLVASRDKGRLNARQLYTSVLVVSCLSLFAHLPTYVLPIGSVFGAEATAALFGVRFVAIFAEIIVILAVSNLVICRFTDETLPEVDLDPDTDEDLPEGRKKKPKKFWPTVWSRSRRTLKRLMIYLIPTFAVMAGLEYFGAFEKMAETMPGLFTFSFLPPQSAVIIPAQALSLYNGAIAAANYLDAGAISMKQAVLTILIGSLVTAPIRTFKHALPTYVAVLGPKTGLVMAVSAQVLRSIFLIICIVAMWMVWH